VDTVLERVSALGVGTWLSDVVVILGVVAEGRSSTSPSRGRFDGVCGMEGDRRGGRGGGAISSEVGASAGADAFSSAGFSSGCASLGSALSVTTGCSGTSTFSGSLLIDGAMRGAGARLRGVLVRDSILESTSDVDSTSMSPICGTLSGFAGGASTMSLGFVVVG
jgi:hypothetical protein